MHANRPRSAAAAPTVIADQAVHHRERRHETCWFYRGDRSRMRELSRCPPRPQGGSNHQELGRHEAVDPNHLPLGRAGSHQRNGRHWLQRLIRGPAPVTVTVSPQAAVLAPEGSSSPGASTPPASEAPAPPRSQAPTTPAPSNDPAATWPETAQEVTSGIAKIHVVTGESGVTGSGFLIADDLLVTAARSSHRMVPLLVS